jgi:Concanavalin A-like lectin/glucanases superfamily/Fibronectin type III domain
MPNKVKLKRSYTSGAVPTTSDLDTNECAINWADGKLFVKNASGSIVTLTLGGGSYTLPTASSSTLGGVRIGSGLSISGGVLSAADSRWDLLLPSAPTSVTATAGSAQATVSWTAPSVAVPVTDYVVQYSSNSGSSWTTVSRSASTTASQIVTGLTNGTSYVFRVAAVNGIGTGSYSASSSSVVAGSEPYFSSVTLLLHMDGTGSSFTDSSGSPKTITAYGSATQTTAQSKWGGKSASLTSGRLTTPSSSAFAYPNDFVIEGWFRFNSNNIGYQPLVSAYASGDSTGWLLTCETNNCIYFYASSGSGWSLSLSSSYTPPTNQWVYIALSRAGTAIRMWADGTLIASGSTGISIASGNTVAVGYYAYYPGGAKSFDGYVDDLRITTGANRGYSGSTITVPTAAFPDY